MACTRAHSTALTTLAVNLLTRALEERDRRAAAGVTRRRAIGLARQFAEDCLLTAPEDAWVIPRDTIRAWIRARSRSRPLPGAAPGRWRAELRSRREQAPDP